MTALGWASCLRCIVCGRLVGQRAVPYVLFVALEAIGSTTATAARDRVFDAHCCPVSHRKCRAVEAALYSSILGLRIQFQGGGACSVMRCRFLLRSCMQLLAFSALTSNSSTPLLPQVLARSLGWHRRLERTVFLGWFSAEAGRATHILHEVVPRPRPLCRSCPFKMMWKEVG